MDMRLREEGKFPGIHLQNRLAVLGHQLGRKLLAKVATLASPDTILRWSISGAGWWRSQGSGAMSRGDGWSRWLAICSTWRMAFCAGSGI